MMHMEITLRSTALDMDTKVTVLFPEDRHHTADTRGKTYPVLYVLNGGKEDCSSWINLSTLFLMCRDLDLVVVLPSGNNSSYCDAVYGQSYFTWISEELPVKMKNLFPITDDPEQTFIMGESMGGYGTARIALACPEKFGKAVILSGGNFHPFQFGATPHRIGIFGSEEEWKTSDNNLFNLVDRLSTYEGHKPEYIFYCGTEDRAYTSCKELEDRLRSTCPDVTVKSEYWHGQHNFFFWNQAIPKALKEFGFDIVENSVV
ncbi:MAG: hypothetical protein K6F23_13505 [Solobacterium sp.]|nr:hypothetical protein [Solobacterium sp.]